MRRRPMLTAVLAAVLLFCLASTSGANLITYVAQRANQERLMVMEDDGSNPVELFVGERRGPAIEGPTVSPAGMEETWILFNDHNDLYRTPPDGSTQELVLCGHGTDTSGASYDLLSLGGIWSPDGSQILFQPLADFESLHGYLALLPAHLTDDGTCSSGWVRIYEPTPPWTVWAGPGAWNHNGSQIAFWETNLETEEGRLVVIELKESGVWEPFDYLPLIPGSTDLPALPDHPWDLSWRPQAGSNLLIFRIRVETASWLASIDLGTREWAYVLDKGSRIQLQSLESYPKWSPNGEEILFTDAQGNLVRWSYPDGDRQVIGSGIRADWQRGISDPDCLTDSDCGTGYICCSGNCIEPKCVSDVLCEEMPPDVCTDDFCEPCSGCRNEFDPSNDPSCVTPEVDCSELADKKPCNAELTCRWDNRNGVCVDN